MSLDFVATGHRAITHNGETYIKLADASVTFGLYLKDIAAKDVEIARLRARIKDMEYIFEWIGRAKTHRLFIDGKEYEVNYTEITEKQNEHQK